jgi:predicted nucleic acid-binding protein
MNGIKSILLDSSFCIRLLKSDADFHQNTVEYFEYFLENKIDLYLSTIVVSEYAVGDNPDNLLSLNAFKLIRV